MRIQSAAAPLAPTVSSPTPAKPAAPATLLDMFERVFSLLLPIATSPALMTFDQDDVADDPNACGTTSLAMVLASYGLITSLAEAQTLDRSIRAPGMFTAPDQLTAAAQRHGLHAAGRNHSSFDELRKELAAGNRVMVLTPGPHWQVAVGVTVDPRTGRESIKLADPANGQVRIESIEDFATQWGQPFGGFGGGLTGFDNYMHVFSTQPLQGRDFDLRATNEFASVAAQFMRGNFFPALAGLPHLLAVAPWAAFGNNEVTTAVSVVDDVARGGGPALLGGLIAQEAGADAHTVDTVEIVVNAVFNPIGFLVGLFA